MLARACSAFMGALSIVLFFLVTRKLFPSRLIAWVSVVLIATRGDVLVNFRRAMQEGPKFLFIMLTLFIASYILLDLLNNKPRRLLYAGLGISSGLTLAAKQDTAPMLVAIYFTLGLIPLLKKVNMQAFLINILYLGASTCLAYASFLAFMPAFWGWWESVFAITGIAILLYQIPVWGKSWSAKALAIVGFVLMIGMTMIWPSQWKRVFMPIFSLIEVREYTTAGQVEYLAGNDLFYLDTIGNKVGFLVKNILISQVMYMEISTFDIPPMREQIIAYEHSIFRGRVNSPILDGVVAVLFVMGIWELSKNFNPNSLFLFFLLGITAAIICIAVQLPWQRYYLILQIPYVIIAGVGAGQIWKWGTKFIHGGA
jgi:hypothetical protein